ncbi:hypothetical protein C1645_824383 [Glomus cerebriforme]|uniref:Uncharacterized protein n=1 Tax=Glomus cerebriforme TaxID=658196 RepID=A0A397SU81_9GLOM|nr:hypothetical protein C1645_824383 [Glomus cerebriforme]
MNTNQQYESNTAPQVLSSNNISQPQENVAMVRYSFFYKAYNDFQIYHITCEETPFEIVSRLLRNHDCVTQNFVQQNNLHVFYYQQPDDKKIYKIICEVVSYTFIIRMLNKINYDIDLSFNEQQQEVFFEEHKVNLEFHLKHDLANYLAPIDTSQQPMADNNIVNQSLDYTQDHINTNI